jgi:propanol-preferring alcohol dehydrogenase
VNNFQGKTLKAKLLQNLLRYADVGFVSDRIEIPLFPRVSREQTFHGSFWGNNAGLTEVMAAQDKIRRTLKIFKFEQLDEYLDLLRAGEIVGRTAMKF